jgi:acetolactate synthase-like protein
MIVFLVILISFILFLYIAYKTRWIYTLVYKVDEQSTAYGGELVADVLKAHGIPYLFCLSGGHISPILVACEKRGIRIIDTRHEANAAFAADAVSRLSGKIGVCVVTAGPGLTNTVTAIKNAQMAESPLLLIGGCAANLSKGRGALQDIDHMSVFKSICKYTISVKRVRQIPKSLRQAIYIAQSGTPGPVFVEFPIDVLYPYHLVEREVGIKPNPKTLADRFANLYLSTYIRGTFAGAFDEQNNSPIPPEIPYATDLAVQNAAKLVRSAKNPVCLLGSQSTLPPTSTSDIAEALESMNIPCFLGGMSRGLLGRNSSIQFRHCRKDALKDADVVLLIGAVCDFRLGYGKVLSRKSKIIIVNRNSFSLYQNSDVFWKPTLAVKGDPGDFIVRLHKVLAERNYKCPNSWIESLRDKDNIKEEANRQKGKETTKDHLNPVRVLQQLEDQLPDNAILVGDGGDFVAIAAYVLRPRGPLTWLDPGAFGTLGVGAGFALGAKLVRPEASVWIIYGDGALGYSIMEYDTFVRHKIPIISVVGNDACWSQIARDQVPLLGSIVGCTLEYSKYDKIVESLGGVGFRLDQSNESEIADIFKQANEINQHQRKSVLINCLIGKTNFREGSISV